MAWLFMVPCMWVELRSWFDVPLQGRPAQQVRAKPSSLVHGYALAGYLAGWLHTGCPTRLTRRETRPNCESTTVAPRRTWLEAEGCSCRPANGTVGIWESKPGSLGGPLPGNWDGDMERSANRTHNIGIWITEQGSALLSSKPNWKITDGIQLALGTIQPKVVGWSTPQSK